MVQLVIVLGVIDKLSVRGFIVKKKITTVSASLSSSVRDRVTRERLDYLEVGVSIYLGGIPPQQPIQQINKYSYNLACLHAK